MSTQGNADMQRLLHDVQQRYRDFLEQRDDLTLLVACPMPEAAYHLKLLAAIDEGESPDVFWTFTEPFFSEQDYVNRVVSRFIQLYQDVNGAREKAPLPRWPEPPPGLLQATQPLSPPVKPPSLSSRGPLSMPAGPTAVACLQQLIQFARNATLETPDQRLVMVFFPLELESPKAFAEFLTKLLPVRFPTDWTRKVRLVIRIGPDPAPARNALHRHPRLSHLSADMSPDAIEKSLEADVSDQSVTLDQRMQALLMLAFRDYSMRRLPDARQKFELLIRYYEKMQQPMYHALCLNGLGEVLERDGQDAAARARFEAALTPAGQAPSVLLNVILNLANLSVKERRYQDGVSYFDLGHQLARKMLMAPLAIEALERKGQCLMALARREEAIPCWETGAQLARALNARPQLKRVLEQLRDAYGQAGQLSQRRKLEQELGTLGA